MLTGCDYDPTYCERGPSMTGLAFVLIGAILGLAILYEIVTGIIDTRREKREQQHPDSWLD